MKYNSNKVSKALSKLLTILFIVCFTTSCLSLLAPNIINGLYDSETYFLIMALSWTGNFYLSIALIITTKRLLSIFWFYLIFLTLLSVTTILQNDLISQNTSISSLVIGLFLIYTIAFNFYLLFVTDNSKQKIRANKIEKIVLLVTSTSTILIVLFDYAFSIEPLGLLAWSYYLIPYLGTTLIRFIPNNKIDT